MIELKPPPLRYEHVARGDLVHIDIKRFAASNHRLRKWLAVIVPGERCDEGMRGRFELAAM